MAGALIDGSRALAAVALGLFVAWTGHVVSLRLLGDARTSTRWCGAAIVALWALVASFWLLSTVRGFSLPVVLLGWVALAGALHGAIGGAARPLHALRGDMARVRALLSGVGTRERLLAAAVGVVAGVRFLRFSAEPPLGWDDLTYHLVKAARWVQAGGFVEVSAPDAWGAYGYFPVAGEILWSWAMLPLRSAALVAPASMAIWALIPLGLYAASRELGARPRMAILASLAVASMPASLAYVSSAYVDNVVVAALALASVFAVRVTVHGMDREVPFVVAGVALAAGAKLTALPFLALALGLALVVGVRRGVLRRRAWGLFGLCLAVSAVAFPTHLRAWVEQGSPLYPYSLHVAGQELLEGHRETSELNREILEDDDARYSLLDSLWFLVSRHSVAGTFLNPGLGAVIILLLAVLATGTLRSREWLAGAFLWLVAMALLAMFFSPIMEVVRSTFMVTTAGRYLVPAFAATGVIASRLGGRLPRLLLTVAILWGVVFALPRGWCKEGAVATLLVAALVGVAGLVMLALSRIPGGWSGFGRAALATLAAAGLVVGVQAVRERVRYPIYEQSADWVDPAYQLHPLHPRYASAWPIWREVGQAERMNVSVTAGFEGIGHNWYLYPLFGERLQHRLLYVPITRTGGITDYRTLERAGALISRSCWLDRLRDAQVGFVASLAPRTTVEQGWIDGMPHLFEEVVKTRDGLHALYRVRRDALERLDAGGRCLSVAQGTNS